jgi:hypothetical protein
MERVVSTVAGIALDDLGDDVDDVKPGLRASGRR